MTVRVGSRGHLAAVTAGYLVLYIALDWVSLIHPSGATGLGITPWNPPAGLTVALFLVYGPGFASAAFVAIVVADVMFRGLSSAPVTIATSALVIALGYGAAAALLRNRRRDATRLNDHRDLLALLGVSLVATGLIAVLVITIFAVGGLLPSADVVEVAVHFWVGDMIGIAGLTPFLLLMGDAERRRPTVRRHRMPEHLLQGAAIAIGLWIIFGLESTNHFEFSYILFLPLIWIALRDGLLGATWGILATQIGLALSIQAKGFDADVTTQFQLLMLAVAFVGLLLGSVVDERRRAETSLRDSEARLQAVVATAPDGILTVDDTGIITSANRAAAIMFRAEPEGPIGRPIAAVLPTMPRAAESPAGAEVIARRLDGSEFDAEIAIGKAAVAGRALAVAVVRDISARKLAERQLKEHETELAHAGRLAVTGEMAASLAHELNQPLTALIGFARACQEVMKTPDGGAHERAQGLIDRVVQQALRAGEIIRSTREFLRRGDSRLGRVDLNRISAVVADLVRTDAALNRIHIGIAMPEDLPPVLADAIQMEQVILNLVRNSMEAMSQVAGGKREIRISAGVDPADPDFVEVRIRDTGPGIPAEVADHLFRPFATTKDSGMGLGLSISRSIVEAHGGRIWSPTAVPGQGAEIRFTVPIYMDTRQ